MNQLSFINSPSLYLEVGQTTLRALSGNDGLEVPLERLPTGRLTAGCKEKLAGHLQTFLKKAAWQQRARVYCAIGARGVTLRRLTLPGATRENISGLLALQIEKEFPVPPEELAWGYSPAAKAVRSETNGHQEFVVAAVRKEMVEEFSELILAQGATPVLTLAAFARSYLCSEPTANHAVLDVGNTQSELICFEQGQPSTVRILAAGEENLEALAAALENQSAAQKIYVSGGGARNEQVALGLAQRLRPGTVCEPLSVPPGPGRSAAILGLRRATENGSGRPLLVLQVKPANGVATVARPAPWKWVGLAALLAISALLLPYAEALLLKPFLARKLASLKADRGRLPMIDRELEFLRFLKQNQPPYLDTLFILAKAAPQGAKVESLSMNRRGDLSLRCTMKDATQVSEFRTKLIDSRLFANVSIDEQAPSPDRQKLNIRISAQWKPVAMRQNLALGPTAEEIEKSKTRVRDQPGMMPGMPMGMLPIMPGMGMPGMPSMEGGMPARMSSSRRSMSGSRPPTEGGPPAEGAGPGSAFSRRYGMPPGGSSGAAPSEGPPPPNQP